MRRRAVLPVALLGFATLLARGQDAPKLPPGALLRIGTPHPPERVLALAFTGDGKAIVAVDEGGVVVQNATTGEVVRDVRFEFPLERAAISDPVLSPDRELVAFAFGREREARKALILDLETGWVRTTIPGKDSLKHLVFSPDGSRLAGVSSGAIEVFDVLDGEPAQTLPIANGTLVESIAFSPDGRSISVARFRAPKVDDLDLATGKTLASHPVSARLSTASIASGCQWLVGVEDADAKATLRLHDLASGECALALPLARRFVRSLTVSPDGRTVIADGVVVDVASGKERWKPHPHGGSVTPVAFSPDGGRVAMGGAERTVCVFDVATGAELPRPRSHGQYVLRTEQVVSVAFEPSGAIVTRKIPGKIERWDATTGARLSQNAVVVSGSFMLTGLGTAMIVSRSPDGAFTWQDPHSDRVRRLPPGESKGRPQSARSPDGKRLLVVASARAWLADAATGEILRSEVCPVNTFAILAVSPDGHSFAASGGTWSKPELWLYGIDKHEDRALEGLTSEVSALAFSPDGSVLACASYRELGIWSRATGKLRASCPLEPGTSRELAFSPDGKTLAHIHYGSLAIHLVDVASLVEVRVLAGHIAPVNAFAFSHDGKLLASASQDETVLVWSVGR
jgi:WD40 repeat protein